MRRYRRAGILVLIILSTALAGLAVSEARRDTTPPKLYVEAPPRAEAGSHATLTVTSDEPVTYRIRYGSYDTSKVTQDWSLELTALAGSHAVSIEATDGAGNTSDEQVAIDGVDPPDVQVSARRELRAGDPLGVHVSWRADAARVTDVAVTFADKPVHVVEVGGGAEAIVGVALSATPGAYPLAVAVTDEFGIVHRRSASVVVTPLEGAVETIHLDPAVAATDTPEAWATEQRALAAAFAASLPAPQWRAPFAIPIEGATSAGFGSARRYQPGGPVSYHTGLDLAVPEGTPVHATNDGTVLLAQELPISGNVVAIDHGDHVVSLYFHQSKILVQAGEKVTRGEVIGLAGTTGLSTGPHLHWEMRVDGVPTNPLAWVGRVFP